MQERLNIREAAKGCRLKHTWVLSALTQHTLSHMHTGAEKVRSASQCLTEEEINGSLSVWAPLGSLPHLPRLENSKSPPVSGKKKKKKAAAKTRTEERRCYATKIRNKKKSGQSSPSPL